MEIRSTPQLMSPTSFLPNVENAPPSDHRSRPPDPIPLQEPVSSASQIPNPQSKLRSGYRHLASRPYVEEYQELVDNLRQAHTKDRRLWQMEREELHERILELESELQLLRGGQGINTTALTDVLSNANLGALSAKPSLKSSSDGTGREFWRGPGGMSDAHPTRTFSDTSSVSTFSNVHLPSISEDFDSTVRKKSAGSNTDSRPLSPLRQSHRLASIPGDRVDANFDGISFKPSGLPPSIVKSILPSISGSPSPLNSPSPLTSLSPSSKPIAEPRPKLLNLPSSLLTADELRLEDAGHTPLARLVSDTSSDASSAVTPTSRVPEIERLPPEPYSTQDIVKPPHERRDSYFPAISESIDEDPILKEPLGLTNDKDGKEDHGFLNALDSKLLEAQRSSISDLASHLDHHEGSTLGKTMSQNGAFSHNGESGTRGDCDDSEPKLRIKRSINFGTVFGAANCGRNI